jgi:hypothetical protein
MTTLHIAHEIVNLPTVEKIPTPRTRAALEACHDILARRNDAQRDRGAAYNELRRVESDEKNRRARAILEGVAAGESPIEAAEQLNLDATLAAEGVRLRELRRAVNDDRDAWSATAAAEGQKALLKLTTAVRMAAEARDELNDSIGILGMHRQFEQNGGGRLALQHPRDSSQFDIGAGIESLREGLGKASRELDHLKPAKAKKGKKEASQ